MAESKPDTFDDLLEITELELRPLAVALRDLITRIDPETVETIRLGDRAATYGIGPRKMKDGYVYVLPYTNWVNLGFYQGVALDDPEGLLEGTGARLRHVKMHSLEDVDRPAVETLIRSALDERRAAVSSGS